MPDQIRVILDSFSSLWQQIMQFLPRLTIGIITMIAGWSLAILVRKGIRAILRVVRLDSIADKSGLNNILIKGGTQYSAVNIIANLTYWFLMFGLTLAVLHSLGLEVAKDLLNRMFLFIPNALTGMLVLVFGSLLAKVARGGVFTSLTNIRIDGAEFISTIVYWALIVLVISIGLEQLSIGGQILLIAFAIAFSGLCLALAIAFGLAGKDWAGEVLDRLWKNSR